HDGKPVARLWDAESGRPIEAVPVDPVLVSAVAWSPAGDTLAGSAADKTVCLWDARTGKVRSTLKGAFHTVQSLAWSPDGKVLAGGYWANVRLWSNATG